MVTPTGARRPGQAQVILRDESSGMDAIRGLFHAELHRYLRQRYDTPFPVTASGSSLSGSLDEDDLDNMDLSSSTDPNTTTITTTNNNNKNNNNNNNMNDLVLESADGDGEDQVPAYEGTEWSVIGGTMTPRRSAAAARQAAKKVLRTAAAAAAAVRPAPPPEVTAARKDIRQRLKKLHEVHVKAMAGDVEAAVAEYEAVEEQFQRWGALLVAADWDMRESGVNILAGKGRWSVPGTKLRVEDM